MPTKMTTIRIPADLLDQVDEFARGSGTTRSAVLQHVVEDIAAGRAAVTVQPPDVAASVRIDGNTLDSAQAAVQAATGQQRGLNAAVVAALRDRVAEGAI